MATLYFTQSSLVINWASASSWQPQQVPTLGDYCIFDANSATCSLNITIGTCSQIDFTNYIRQFRFGANALNVYGTVSFGINMGYSFSTTIQYGGYNLAILASASITSNGSTVSVPTIFYSLTNNNNFYTITDYLNMSENFSTGSPNVVATTQTINGGTISLYKGFAINTGGNLVTNLTTGSSNIVMLGTGTLATQTNTSGGLGNNFTIQGTGTITLPTNFYYRTGLFSIIGTPTLSGSNNILYVTGACSYIAASSSSTYLIPFSLNTGAAQTVTLLSDIHSLRGINCLGLTLNGFNYYIYGNTLTNSTTLASGTTVYRISGTGSGSNVNLSATTAFSNNIVINTPGSCTFTTNFYWNGTSLIYTAGNVTFPTAGNNTFLCNPTNAPTIDTNNGILFTNFTPQNNAGTMSLSSNLQATTITLQGANLRFTGVGSWTTNNLTCVSNATTTRTGLGLAAGLTYTVTKNLTITPPTLLGGTGIIFGIKSNTAGSQTKFVLSPGATQSIYSVVTDDIDSSAGQTIWVYNYDTATVSTNTLNWRKLQYTSIQSSTSNVS